MKFALTLALTLLLASIASAQRVYFPEQQETTPAASDVQDVRSKLIQRYVLGNHMAWGVAVCGEEDEFGIHSYSYLTIYLYSDAQEAFAQDFEKLATHVGKTGLVQVDGIAVRVELIERPKKGASNGEPAEPTIERNSGQRQHFPRRRSASLLS